MTERHVAGGEGQLSRQRGVISGLQAAGRVTVGATRLLMLFEDIQAMHIAHRDRLREMMLAAATPKKIITNGSMSRLRQSGSPGRLMQTCRGGLVRALW